MLDTKLPRTIYLAEMKIESPLDFLNLLLEYSVFYSWIFFKNRPRGNFFLLRAVLIVATFGVIYYHFFSRFELMLAGVDVDPVILMFAIVSMSYLSMSGVFHNKSRECTMLYQDYLKTYGARSFDQAELQAVNLAITLLTLDLWAHRSFAPIFSSILSRAIDLEKNSSELVSLTHRGRLTCREARLILERYQEKIMEEIKGAG